MSSAPPTWRELINVAFRYVDAVVSVLHAIAAVRRYPRYLRDRRDYGRLARGGGVPRWRDDWPQLADSTFTTPFDPHYAFQDGWAARQVAERVPERHVDVGSRITFVIGLSAFVPVTFIDLRPLKMELSGLETRGGSVLDLPFADRELMSLSCLHVAEHIGLGRYGDPLDPEGTVKAARELQRVLGSGGTLYFSVPVGRERVAFNAHRVLDPCRVPELFPELRLDGFAGVDDAGRFRDDIEPVALAGCAWGCGFYRLKRD